MTIIITWKKEGLSMGELLESLSLNQPATYAGRLDPLASGVCVILSGQDRHQKDKYLGLTKQYELDVVFGIQTDSLDPLGIVTNTVKEQQVVTKDTIQTLLQKFSPEYKQTPPTFSSIPLNGKPSFVQARQESPMTPPPRLVQINKIELINIYSIESTELVSLSIERVQPVQGDFRQSQIIDSWKEVMPQLPTTLTACKLRVNCTSGTYMRSLARDLGVKLNTPALALRILRSRVGHFKLPFVQ